MYSNRLMPLMKKPVKSYKHPSLLCFLNVLVVILFTISIPLVSLASPYNVEVKTTDLDDEKRNQLINNLSLIKQKNSPYLTPDYINSLYEKGASELQNGLRVFGYYKAEIKGSVNREVDPWEIQFDVKSGPALKIRNSDIDVSGVGKYDEVILAWRNSIAIKEGDVLNQKEYENEKSSIQQILQERGYFDGNITVHQLRISLEKYYADVVLHVTTGDRYKFGEIKFSLSQDIFDQSYLDGFSNIEKGEHFDAAKLSELQKLLSGSNEFQKVEVVPLLAETENHHVPVKITLIPRKAQRYSLGLGFGTDTGPRTRLGVQRRQLTRTGHRMEGEIFYSRLRTEFALDYYIPLAKPATDYFNINGSREIEDTDDTYRQTNSFSISTVYALQNWWRTITLTYLDEQFEIGNENDTAQLLIPAIGFRYVPLGKQSTRLIQWRFNVELRGAHEDAFSDTSFLQSNFTLKNRLNFHRHFSLVSRADVGWSAIEEFTLLPVSQRFFAGGDNSIRGFAYKSLGPTDESGDVVGGSRLLVGSLELQYMVAPKWDIAAFIDAGNAFDTDEITVEQGAGFGFGYLLPVGSIRAYAANALSKDGNPWRLHLTVGAEW